MMILTYVESSIYVKHIMELCTVKGLYGKCLQAKVRVLLAYYTEKCSNDV